MTLPLAQKKLGANALAPFDPQWAHRMAGRELTMMQRTVTDPALKIEDINRSWS